MADRMNDRHDEETRRQARNHLILPANSTMARIRTTSSPMVVAAPIGLTIYHAVVYRSYRLVHAAAASITRPICLRHSWSRPDHRLRAADAAGRADGQYLRAHGAQFRERTSPECRWCAALRRTADIRTVVSQSSASFREVGLIEYPRKGIYCIVFITTQTNGEIVARAGQELVSVFLPTTPNPTSGFLLFVPKTDVQVLDMSIEEGAKLIISAGLVEPKHRKGEGEPIGVSNPAGL